MTETADRDFLVCFFFVNVYCSSIGIEKQRDRSLALKPRKRQGLKSGIRYYILGM